MLFPMPHKNCVPEDRICIVYNGQIIDVIVGIRVCPTCYRDGEYEKFKKDRTDNDYSTYSVQSERSVNR